jgi:hypothetical protein
MNWTTVFLIPISTTSREKYVAGISYLATLYENLKHIFSNQNLFSSQNKLILTTNQIKT